MIIWSGLGILAAFAPVAGYVLMGAIISALAGPEYIRHHSWPGASGTLIGAGGVWVMSKKVSDPGHHSFFGIPIQYLAPLFVAIAVLMFLIKTDSAI